MIDLGMKSSAREKTVEKHFEIPQNCIWHWKNGISSTVWKFYFENISRVFLEYFHTTENISIIYGIGQNYGNWIFQPFSRKFPKYFHEMEEVQFFQCTAHICTPGIEIYLHIRFKKQDKKRLIKDIE